MRLAASRRSSPGAFSPSTPSSAASRRRGVDYLRTLAIARIVLDNFDNLQASWVTQGGKVGQLSLAYGANDMGSVMIEENVVRAAGAGILHGRNRDRAQCRRCRVRPEAPQHALRDSRGSDFPRARRAADAQPGDRARRRHGGRRTRTEAISRAQSRRETTGERDARCLTIELHGFFRSPSRRYEMHGSAPTAVASSRSGRPALATSRHRMKLISEMRSFCRDSSTPIRTWNYRGCVAASGDGVVPRLDSLGRRAEKARRPFERRDRCRLLNPQSTRHARTEPLLSEISQTRWRPRPRLPIGTWPRSCSTSFWVFDHAMRTS